MKILILLALFTSSLSLAEIAVEKVNVTEAIERETYKSINNFFNYNDREIQSIWGLEAYKCSDKDECLYYVVSYTNAQVGYTYQYGLHECRTLIKKEGRKLVENGSDCEFIND